MTSPAQAQRLVLISVFGLLAIATYRGKLSDARVTTSKRLWGTGVLAVMLGLAADVAPQVAGPFALLVLVGSFTSGGDKAIQNFLGKVGGQSSSSGPPIHVHDTPKGTHVPQPTHPGTNR